MARMALPACIPLLLFALTCQGGAGGEGGGTTTLPPPPPPIPGSYPKPDLVLGLDLNVRLWELRVFLASIRSSGCPADVVLFLGGPLTRAKARLAQRHGATFVAYDAASLSETHGPPGVHRFTLYRRFLATRVGAYGRVLHTDVRDVVFQDNPFERITVGAGGAFFLESDHLLIGTSPTNVGWMTDNCTTYEREGVLGRVRHRLRSCSGSMMGTAEAVAAYASLMEAEQQRTRGVNGWCADQAVHQALLWLGGFGGGMANVTLHRNEDGPLCTAGDVPTLQLSGDGEVVNARGEPYAVVHQYDRHRRLLRTVLSRYADDDGEGDQLGEGGAGGAPPYAGDEGDQELPFEAPSGISRHTGADTSLPPPPPAAAPAAGECGGGACPRAPIFGSGVVGEHAEEMRRIALGGGGGYPEGTYEGRGVVMSAGGQLQVANAYVAIRLLRGGGCSLPVEVFYAHEGEMSAEAVAMLQGLGNVSVVDASLVEGPHQGVPLAGFQAKAVAILVSSFEEVLWIDADNAPIGDASALFGEGAYRERGSLFWQDWSLDPHWLDAPFLASFGVTMVPGEREFEAGQLLLNKRRCWLPLQLTVYMNLRYHYFYRRMYGDKDTWRLAFKLLGEPYGLSPHPADAVGRIEGGPGGPRLCGDTMLHKAPSGAPAFLHRTLQTLPGAPTPGPRPPLTRAALEGAAGGELAWEKRTVGGWQRIQPRLDPTADGWRVERAGEGGGGRWCVLVDADPTVRVEDVMGDVRRAEGAMREALVEVARAGAVETLAWSEPS